MIRKALAIALLTSSPALFADAPPPPGPIQIHRADGAIRIDGDLSDPAWQTAAKIDQFYETSPGDNIPARVKTVAYFTYDNKNFYIGVRCEDPHPEQIRAPYVDRDQVIGTDDNIAVFLDTRNDKRTALELRVNPRGIQGDGVFNDANFSEDFSPDFFYDTAAKIDSGGWSAEFAIPFSSLRYPHQEPQTWNVMVWRNYPREFRYAFQSAPIPRSSNCYVCHVHPVVGLTNLPEAGHFVAAPYVTAQQVAVPRGGLGTPLENEPLKKDAGIDVKWTPTVNNAIDLTVNPDFSQIEADVAQITANQRFAVFFPEKRPFFLEGFDIFDTPMQVAYTRTITDPRFGARTTGKIGASAYTLLVTQDEGGGLTIIPGANNSRYAPWDFKSIDAIGRVRRDFGQSFIGAVFTDREVRGGGHNRVFGPDFSWRPNQSDSLVGEFLVSDTQNPDRRDISSAWNGAKSTSYAATATYNRQKDKYDLGGDVRQIGDKFRADLGFIPQVGYREVDAFFGLRFFREKGPFRFIRPNIFVDQQWDLDGQSIFRRISPGVGIQGTKNLGVFINLRNDEIQGREQTYASWQVQIDPSRRFTRIVFFGNAGQQIDFANGRTGRGASLGLQATVRPIDKLTLDGLINREYLDVTAGRLYTAYVERIKATYSFSAKSLLRLIGQYQKTDSNPALYNFPVARHDGQFLGSILYSYKLNWQTVLFAGYGDNRVLSDARTLEKADRSFFFKLSYALQR
jgi:hypothetical protein